MKRKSWARSHRRPANLPAYPPATRARFAKLAPPRVSGVAHLAAAAESNTHHLIQLSSAASSRRSSSSFGSRPTAADTSPSPAHKACVLWTSLSTARHITHELTLTTITDVDITVAHPGEG
jgi:hypothetical protein